MVVKPPQAPIQVRKRDAEGQGRMLFDVLTVGRIGVDIYPLEVGVGLEDVETFGKFLGGSPTNVAVAAAKHGLSSAVITKTGDYPYGRCARRALKELNVDDNFVGGVDWLPTPGEAAAAMVHSTEPA